MLRTAASGDEGAFAQLWRDAHPPLLRYLWLGDAAEDVASEVWLEVARKLGRFRGSEPAFRGWLFTLAHRRLCDWFDSRQRRERGSGDSAMVQLLYDQPERADQKHWEEDLEREAFARAAEKIRPIFSETTWQAFWQTAIEGKSGKDVAQELGLSVGAVYLAKSRVMVRLKAQVAELEP